MRASRRAIEAALLLVAVACLSWYDWRTYEIGRGQRELTALVHRTLGDVIVPAETLPADGVVGELEIPRLHLSAPVKAGDDDAVLDYSVGYLPDTPLPWLPGNSAFAAHRDRLFRPLEHIRTGDAITLTTTHGALNYRVLRTLIVNPQDVWVLQPLPKVSLTLITCYPFSYVGHAPHRFIVQAEKLEDVID
jgi:sortase A